MENSPFLKDKVPSNSPNYSQKMKFNFPAPRVLFLFFWDLNGKQREILKNDNILLNLSGGKRPFVT